MTALARRLDPCANWFKLLARTHGQILWAFPALLFVLYVGSVSWPAAFGGFQTRLFQRSADAPLAAEARRLGLSYETVVADPAAYVGKPVAWCLDRPSADVSYVSGSPSRRVSTDAPYSEYMTNAASGGYCYDVLAVVEGGWGGVVKLHVIRKL